MKNILLILIGKRKNTAVKVQEILTKYGCNIKTRLGLHDTDINSCSEKGLVILELLNNKEENAAMAKELESLENIKVNFVEMSL